jgi:hypothetical protein
MNKLSIYGSETIEKLNSRSFTLTLAYCNYSDAELIQFI